MDAKEAKKLVKSKVDDQLEIVHCIIDGLAKLGAKALSLDQRIVGLHCRTLKLLEEEGFLISRQRHVIDPERNIEEDMIFIDWH